MRKRECRTCRFYGLCSMFYAKNCAENGYKSYQPSPFWTEPERAGLKALGNEYKIDKGKWNYYMKNKDLIAPSWQTATFAVRWAICAFVQAAIDAKAKGEGR